MGPAAATAAGEPDRTTRRTDGVTSVDGDDGQDVDRPQAVVGCRRRRAPAVGERSRRPSLGRRKRADPADPGGMGSTGPAIEDGSELTLGHAFRPRYQRGRLIRSPSTATLRDEIGCAMARAE